jgi:hypothetical protein
MNDQLSLQRLLWLLRADVIRNHRSWLVASGTVALLALAINLATAADRVVGGGFYQSFFACALFALGTLATSDTFADLHGRATNTALLLLPASALEKTVSRLLLTTVGLFLYLLVLTTVLSWVLEGINTLAFGVQREVYTPFDSAAWYLLPHYLVVQSVFFLGGAWFRKLRYLKTIGIVLLIAFGLAAAAVAMAWLVIGTPWDGSPSVRWDDDLETSLEGLTYVAPIVYYFALPVFCWFVAWLRVTESQVSHGI